MLSNRIPRGELSVIIPDNVITYDVPMTHLVTESPMIITAEILPVFQNPLAEGMGDLVSVRYELPTSTTTRRTSIGDISPAAPESLIRGVPYDTTISASASKSREVCILTDVTLRGIGHITFTKLNNGNSIVSNMPYYLQVIIRTYD